MNDMKTVLACEHLHKVFHDGSSQVSVLRGIDLTVQAGEQIAIMGASGSGKSTFLHLLGGLDTPTQGCVKIDGAELSSMSEKKRCQIRNTHLGFVYQFHHLLPEFTALENVCMPLLLGKKNKKAAHETAQALLNRVGLEKRLHHKPAQLSGGERQRVAIARALVTQPKCLLADEPTGNLDQKNAEQIYDLIMALNQEMQTSLVVVTHDLRLASRLSHVYEIQDGQLGRVQNP